ncbi:MAG: GNAT family N-acetyltransferase [Specibacter sp.]
MEVTIRTAGPSDAAALAELAAVTFPLACPAGSSADDVAAFVKANLGAQAFAGYLADPRRVVFVAEDAATKCPGRLLAYTMLVDSPPSDVDVASVAEPDAVELSKCYAHPDTHGGGVAAQILRTSLDWVAGNGNRAVWLGVNSENGRARTFYEKHGFTVAGTKSFQLGSRVEHDYVMMRPRGKSTTGY